MSRLVWGESDKRLHETGVDRGVFYPQGGVGVPWNGLIAVSEAPSGADILEVYYDGTKTASPRNRESFSGSIDAVTVPKGFDAYEGIVDGFSQQRRKSFNFSYSTKTISETDPNGHYKIHLVYNVVVNPATKNYNSLGDRIEPLIATWNFNTIPEFLPSGETASHFIIDTSIAHSWATSALEDIIYGSPVKDPRMPSVLEVIELFESTSIFRVTDHGDGTWTAEGPDSAIEMLEPTVFQITWPSALYIDGVTYKLSSL